MENFLLRVWKEENGHTYQPRGQRFVNVRLLAAEKYSWAIPNEEALQEISKYQPLIELGAGNGYWAKLLKDKGSDIIPVDISISEDKSWTIVTKGGLENLIFYPNRTLFMCWVPQKIARPASRVYKNDVILWVGEPIEFKDFEQTKKIEIPQWDGYKDSLYVFKRKQD